jgi:hypothetical protein
MSTSISHIFRKVTKEEGEALAKQLGCAFIEASGKHNENIEHIFNTTIAEIEKESQATPGGQQNQDCIIL